MKRMHQPMKSPILTLISLMVIGSELSQSPGGGERY